MAPCEGMVLSPNTKTNQGLQSGNAHSGQFKDVPSFIENPANSWLDGKKVDDDVGPYWRIHDKLYDLTDFINKHPGGKDRILMTKGTDITEAFLTSHITLAPEKLLSKYFAKNTTKPRSSPYTFHEDGFFMTFKKKARVILEEIGTGPDISICILQDILMLSFFLLTFLASVWYSYTVAFFAGISLTLTILTAHNFVHQRGQFRRFYFDLSLLSSYEFSITHNLSHHLFTNTRYDIEVTDLDPLLIFFPKTDKTFLQRYGSQGWVIIVFASIALRAFCDRVVNLMMRRISLRPENLVPVVELFAMCYLAPSVGAAIRLWLMLHTTCSATVFFVGLTVGHHHPDVYHEGDKFRQNPDWGLCQLDTSRDRSDFRENLFMKYTTLGDHSLHHLLPAVDHSKLDALYPAFFETCKEFNIPHEFHSQWDLTLGFYKQLAKNNPTLTEPGYKTTKQD